MQSITLGRIIVLRLNGCSPARKSLFWCLAATVLLLQGCATPAEIKAASKTQLALIDSLDGAVGDLNSAINKFHRDQADLIRTEGRMRIAKQAVLLAVGEDAKVEADDLFDIYKSDIYPWIAGAYSGPLIDQRIKNIEKVLAKDLEPDVRVKLRKNLNELRIARASQSAKPPDLDDLEQIILQNLENVASTEASVAETLELLRVQIALMKAMQTRIDDWLSIDVSPSQEQIDGLIKSFGEARTAIKGGGP